MARQINQFPASIANITEIVVESDNTAEPAIRNTFRVQRRNSTTSNADRDRVITAYDDGTSIVDISRILSIKKTTIYGILKKYHNTGVVEADKRGGDHPQKLTEDQKNQVKEWVDDNCQLSLKVLVEKVFTEFQIRISTTYVYNLLSRFHYSMKRLHLIPERRNSTEVIETRKEYALNFSSILSIYSEQELIFIDEVGFNVSMRTTRGRSQIGTPATLNVPTIRSRNISIACAMNKNGLLFYKSFNRALNKEKFIEYITELKEVLIDKEIHRCVFIMDNVKFHKSPEVLSAINNENTTVKFLPPYSPFLNPIENMFSKWKEITKRANPRNEDDLMRAIEIGSTLISSQDCSNYVRNMWSYIPRCIEGEIILN